MSNSPLVCYTQLSPNCSERNDHAIDTITIHCMAGNLTVESCGALFARPATQASSNYGIGSDGRIALYVPESKRSWATSSKSNDCRAITIEVANNGGAPDWPVSDRAYNALIDLLVDICKRNKIDRLRWKADKNLVGKVSEQNMTVHRWFANKACPGNYLYNRHGEIADAVNARLESEDTVTQAEFDKMLENYMARQAVKEPAAWSADARAWAEKNEILAGDINGNKMYRSYCTREQMVVFLKRLVDLLNK